MADASRTVVVTDASVVINLIITGRLTLLAQLEGYRFVAPDEVFEEIRKPEQRAVLDEALSGGVMERCAVDVVESAGILLELTDVLGAGELACLALAEQHGWTVASDEKRRFRREAVKRLGADRLVGTVELYVAAIASGVLTVVGADTDKALLERHRFQAGFGSFGD